MVVKDRSTVNGNTKDGLWFNLTSSYSGPTSSVMDSDIADNGRYGVNIAAQPALPVAKFPRGNRNNMYGNLGGKEINSDQTRRDADWTGNYWGANIYHWLNPSACPNVGQFALGRLAPRPSSATPAAGPISSGAYAAGSPPVLCYYDGLKIGPTDFSPYYLGGAPAIPIPQTLGGLGATRHSKSLTVLREDPVNAATGSFTHETTDLSLPGTGSRSPSRVRTTRSIRSQERLDRAGSTIRRPLLTIDANGDINARMEDGQQFKYVLQTDGSFSPPPGALSTLASVTGGYELTSNDQVRYRFDSGGRLTSVKDRHDQGLDYAYDGSGRLQTVTDAAAREITSPTTGPAT